MASVASFFISRIDAAIDAIATARLKTVASAGERALLWSMIGKVDHSRGSQAMTLPLGR
jgi:transaldolase / glucose-6-phosphate isomerase